MAGEVAASPVELCAVAGWVEQIAGEISDAVDRQMREVRVFLGTDWQGTAATSHEDPWTEWEDGARRVIGSFGADADLLRRAADEFHGTDTRRAEALESKSSLDLPPVV